MGLFFYRLASGDTPERMEGAILEGDENLLRRDTGPAEVATVSAGVCLRVFGRLGVGASRLDDDGRRGWHGRVGGDDIGRRQGLDRVCNDLC